MLRGLTLSIVIAGRALTVIFSAFALVGCGEPPSNATAERAFTVVASADASRVSSRAGVDLERLVAESAGKVLSRLPHRGRVRIEVRLEAGFPTIPEIGVGGFASPRLGHVLLTIDGTPPGGLQRTLEIWIPQVVAHELHHSSRIRTGPGYGTTLAEALVTEGLAEHFVDEVFPNTPPRPWDHVLSKAQERAFWRRARPQLWLVYDHQTWFFGGYKVPRWTGYTLGYRIVDAYLRQGHTAAGAVRVEARAIIKPYAQAG